VSHSASATTSSATASSAMANTPDFAALQSSVTSALVSTTKTANQLAAQDLPFHRSLEPSIATNIDRQNARLLSLAERLLSVSAPPNAESVTPAPKLSDIEAVEGNWRAVVGVVDGLLERADTALDEFTGAVRRLGPGAGAAEERGPAAKAKQGRQAPGAWRNQEIDKPQLDFDHVPRNDETVPFRPLLESKPHARTPLVKKPAAGGKGEQYYPHPYQKEIEEYAYPPEVYTVAEPIMYRPFEETSATFVDTEEGVDEMLEALKKAKEIAIDLEHHDQRSYIGIVSLMQISTRDKDWIIDTLKPWRRKLSVLNEVFANPAILKVLHGAFMDVMWLQRDLGLYLVGLFDTHCACRALGYTGGSYAYLLKRFTGVDAQKQYQTADWRIRPLPQELLDYARSDTHYLLYIYDNLRNELIERSDFEKPDKEGDKVNDVLVRSSETALQRYEHPVYDYELGQGPGGWYKLLARTPALLSKEQFAVFRAVHKWRDEVAREQDDSVHYVMPNHQVFAIAKAMPLNRAEVLGIAQPTSQTVRLRADELVAVITEAREEGAMNGPDMVEVMSKVEPQFSRRSAAHADAVPVNAVAPGVPSFGAPILAAPAPAMVNGASSAKPKSSAPSPTAASPQNLRSSTSTFWGPALENQDRGSGTSAPAIDLHVPLPSLTADIFAAGPQEAAATPAEPADSPSAAEQDNAAEDAPGEGDVFVVKEVGKGKKRKRPAPSSEAGGVPLPSDGMAAQSDGVAVDADSEAEEAAAEAAEKAARKQAEKEARKAEKAAKKNKSDTQDTGTDDVEEVPFDYEAAPSILNPPRETREEAKKKGKGKGGGGGKEVNPYAKAMDTSKGLPRGQKERAGRSGTFKN
jgi:exosome complex exonuclease RRP6